MKYRFEACTLSNIAAERALRICQSPFSDVSNCVICHHGNTPQVGSHCQLSPTLVPA